MTGREGEMERAAAASAACLIRGSLFARWVLQSFHMKAPLAILAILAALVVLILIGGCGAYNRLVGLKQQVDRSWADVQNVYQRRADLVPNLVRTVEGAANFEKSTLTDVIQARQQVTKVQLDASSAPTDPQTLQRFQQTQDQL